MNHGISNAMKKHIYMQSHELFPKATSQIILLYVPHFSCLCKSLLEYMQTRYDSLKKNLGICSPTPLACELQFPSLVD